MKRNIGIIVLLIAQLLNGMGIDVKIGQTEIDTIASGIGIITATVGVIHDFIRRQAKIKTEKKAQ